MDERIGGARTGAVPVKLANGAIVYVELTGGSPERPVAGTFEFDDAVKAIKGVCEQVGDALKAIKPQRFSVEMGFEFTVGTGGFTAWFAKGDASANVKITVEWEEAHKR